MVLISQNSFCRFSTLSIEIEIVDDLCFWYSLIFLRAGWDGGDDSWCCIGSLFHRFASSWIWSWKAGCFFWLEFVLERKFFFLESIILLLYGIKQIPRRSKYLSLSRWMHLQKLNLLFLWIIIIILRHILTLLPLGFHFRLWWVVTFITLHYFIHKVIMIFKLRLLFV